MSPNWDKWLSHPSAPIFRACMCYIRSVGKPAKGTLLYMLHLQRGPKVLHLEEKHVCQRKSPPTLSGGHSFFKQKSCLAYGIISCPVSLLACVFSLQNVVWRPDIHIGNSLGERSCSVWPPVASESSCCVKTTNLDTRFWVRCWVWTLQRLDNFESHVVWT